jgi:EEF1A lysine methyltransferase 2
MSGERKEHWEEVYNTKEIEQLGWYEETPEKSLDLIERCGIGKDELILDVGSGASTLIDSLVERGYRNIVATDISEEALRKLKERLGERGKGVRFIVDDLTKPEHLGELRDVAVWHDRAVLHFLTEEGGKEAYLSVLNKVVRKGGHVIIAAFSLEGAKKCSGLDVRRYDERMLEEFLGDEFKLVEYFDYLYHMPSGDTRPYVYTLFERKGGVKNGPGVK